MNKRVKGKILRRKTKKPFNQKKQKRLGYALLAGLLFAAALVVLSLENCYVRIWGDLEQVALESIQDTTRQAADILSVELENRFVFLDNLARDIAHNPEDVQERIDRLDVYAEEYCIKRIWFMNPNGEMVSNDGEEDNFSYRDYFRRSIKGEPTISGVLNDTLNPGERINVICVPVYNASQEIIGVAGITYDAQVFRELLNIDFFQGKGLGYIVDEEGNIISMSSHAENAAAEDALPTNLFSDVISDDAMGGKVEERIREWLSGRDTDGLNVVSSGHSYFCCESLENYCPTLPWFFVTEVSAETVSVKMHGLFSGMRSMLFMIALIGGLLVGCVLVIYRYHSQSLHRAAYVDPLTGGDNYASFLRRMEGTQTGYMVSAELDDLKLINGMFGTRKGNEVLRCMYESIEQHLHEDEYVACVNEDRFVFYLHEERRPPVYERLRQIERDIHRLSGRLGVLHIVPRFGVYAMREDEDIQRVCELSNLALCVARDQGETSVAFYQDIVQNSFFESLKMEDRFDAAIAERQFKVFYQPKCNPQTGAVVAAEGLARWRQEDGTLLSPSRFIPLFEKNGEISRFDEYMFTSVCEQLSEWKKQGVQICPVSVNLSRASLCRQGVALNYKRILEGYGLSTWMVPLEVTESAMISDGEVLDVMQEFYRYGFRIEIDDFGRGQSTIPMLKLPFVDTVKLDKSLIDCIGDRKGETILRQIICLCYELGLYTTAEGVEKRDQVDFLRALECTDIQGYYFYEPMPAEKFEELLKTQKNDKQA